MTSSITAATCSSALRRDAADVQADAAERREALDQHRLHAEVGGAEGGRVAAGAGAEHEHVALEVGAAGVAARRTGAGAAGAAGAALRLRRAALPAPRRAAPAPPRAPAASSVRITDALG